LATNISTGIVANRALYLWAYQLDRYRRQVSPALVFNGVSFIWLLLGTIFGFTLINYGLLKIDPSQFTTDHGHATALAVTLYSFASLFLQEAGGIRGTGTLAQAIQLAAALLGLVVIAGFVVNVVVTARRERNEGELQQLISTLKRRVREQETKFREQYDVGVDEAYQRLVQLRAGFAFILTYMTASIPDDFLDSSEIEPPES
jgi:hypothetical protein